MDELLKLLVTGGGSSVVTAFVVAGLFREREKRRDGAERKIEEQREAFEKSVLERLDAVSAKVDSVHADSRVRDERWVQMQAASQAVLDRVNGMSAAYGGDIKAMSTAITELRVRVDQLARRRK